MTPDRQRAKRMILEILRQAGGSLGKSRICKAFWLSHLYFAKEQKGFLSSWPIVRMPNGPGIDKGEKLLQQLVDSGDITRHQEPRGPLTETICTLAVSDLSDNLPLGADVAIKEAVDFAKSMTVGELSKWSHEYSRSWQKADDGDEQDIYTDLVSDEDYCRMQGELSLLDKAFEESFVWSAPSEKPGLGIQGAMHSGR